MCVSAPRSECDQINKEYVSAIEKKKKKHTVKKRKGKQSWQRERLLIASQIRYGYRCCLFNCNMSVIHNILRIFLVIMIAMAVLLIHRDGQTRAHPFIFYSDGGVRCRRRHARACFIFFFECILQLQVAMIRYIPITCTSIVPIII